MEALEAELKRTRAELDSSQSDVSLHGSLRHGRFQLSRRLSLIEQTLFPD